MAPKRKKVTEFVRKTSSQPASEDSMGTQILGKNSGSIYLKRIKMLKRRMRKLHQENLLLKAANEQLVMKTNETTLNAATINEARNILLTDKFNQMVEYNRTKEANKKLQEVINVLKSDLTNAIGHLGNLSITLINATQYASIATSEQPSQDNQETDSPHFSNNYPDQRSRGQKSARVSPMVRGMPIQHPTIKLRRVQVPPTEYDNVSVDEARLSRHETRNAEGPRYENPLTPIVEEEEEGQIRRKKGRLGHRFNNRRSFPGPRQVNGASTTEREALINLEPVVRLRDVSTLLNNSSLCTIPQERKEWVEDVEDEGRGESDKNGGGERKAEGDPRAGEGCSWWQYRPSTSPLPPTANVPVSSSQPGSVLNETYNIETSIIEKSVNISAEPPETVNVATSPAPSTLSNSKVTSAVETVSPGVTDSLTSYQKLTPVVEVSAIKSQNSPNVVETFQQESEQELLIVNNDSLNLKVNKRRGGNRKAVLENCVPEASSTPLVKSLMNFVEMRKNKRVRKNTGSSSSSDFRGFTNSTESISQLSVFSEVSVLTRSRSKRRKSNSTEDSSRESSVTSGRESANTSSMVTRARSKPKNKESRVSKKNGSKDSSNLGKSSVLNSTVQSDQSMPAVRKSSRVRKPIDYKEKLVGKLRR